MRTTATSLVDTPSERKEKHMRYDPHDSRWMTAANRAIEQEIRASKFLCQSELQTPGTEAYLVESSRKDGSWYVVELHRNVIIDRCRLLLSGRQEPDAVQARREGAAARRIVQDREAGGRDHLDEGSIGERDWRGSL